MRLGEGVKGFSGSTEPRYPGEASECQRHSAEGGQKRERRRQVHDYAAQQDQHTRAQFQQPFAQRPDLSPRAVGTRSSQAQLLHQHVGGGGQQHAELIGPELAADFGDRRK